LRDSGDEIEQEGKRRAIRRAEEAEIRLFVFDASHPAAAAGAAAWPGPDTILVANKIDLLLAPAQWPRGQADSVMPGLDPGIHGAETGVAGGREGVDAHRTSLPRSDDPGARPRALPGGRLRAEGPRDQPGHNERKAPGDALPVSALTGEGIDDLLSVLGGRVAQNYSSEAPVLTRARHRQALGEAVASLRGSLAAPLLELRAEDLRVALRSLGRITGAVDVEDLLDVIFRDFCIGK
jgi:tRNA U34 5-carboxymethylaminomethyl modifying GTPase MnmE/TrmE